MLQYLYLYIGSVPKASIGLEKSTLGALTIQRCSLCGPILSEVSLSKYLDRTKKHPE